MFFISFISVFIGWVVQGLIGLGSGIISTAILLFFFNAKEVVVSLSVIALIGTVYLSISNYRGKIFFKDTFLLIIFSFLGAGIGSFLLEIFHHRMIEMFFGFFILFTGFYDLWLKQRNINLSKRFKSVYGAITGFLGGVVSGVIGGAGPLYAFYLNQYFHSKEDFKFVISFIFMVLNVERIFFYLLSPDIRSYFSMEILIPGILGVLSGAYIGDTLTRRVKQDHFKMLISLSIMFFGFYFVFRSFSS